MMIGIRKAIVELYHSEFDKELLEEHFLEKKMYELSPTKYSGYHERDSCKFRDYSPRIFERIRQLHGIQNE